MDYSDDGITLDYDILKGFHPNNNVVLKSTKRGGPQKIEFAGFFYYDRRRIRKNSSYLKSFDSMGSIPETLKSFITPDSELPESKLQDQPSETLDDSTNSMPPPDQKLFKNSKKIVKKPGKPGRKKKHTAGSMIVKKQKKMIKRTKVDAESTKDNSNGSIKSDGEPEAASRKEEFEPKNSETQENKKNKSQDKPKQDELPILMKRRSERPPFGLDDRSEPGFLINPIPIFSNERHKNLKIYDVNRLYMFDPLSLGL
jgi:hypothetical protein